MTSATKELRHLLDERGIEHFDYDKPPRKKTQWKSPDGERHLSYTEHNNPEKTTKLTVHWFPTPEDAIAATLGSEDSGWRSIALGLFDSLEKADLETAQRWIVDSDLLRGELAYGEAKAATLGSGKLTAEQVREAWTGNLKRDCLYDPPMPDWQAIADELNATRTERTCRDVSKHENDFECSICGDYWSGFTPDIFHHCPNCGAKVVSDDE